MPRIAVIGGGAAGLCCADKLAFHSGYSVTVFEQNERIGKKLLSTGNGRCNMTNRLAAPSDYSAPDFVAPAMKRYPPEKVCDFFASLSLFTHTDSEGRVYPLSNQASGVLDALRLEAKRCGVQLRTGVAIEQIKRSGSSWLLGGERFDAVVLACGGKAAVKTHNGCDLLRSVGIPVTATAPGLVKLTTSSPAAKQLKGVRAGVRLVLQSGGTILAQERGELLFGDGVLSGIAAMNLSSVVNRLQAKEKSSLTVSVDFVPDLSYDTLLALLSGIVHSGQRQYCEDLLSGFLPKAIGLMLLRKAAISSSLETTGLKESEIKKIAEICKGCIFPVTGTKSFADAQIMLGGAALSAFDRQTLEAKKLPHFYCIGELLDVDAPCGGYNLQWAFSSALLCADAILQEDFHDSDQ